MKAEKTTAKTKATNAPKVRETERRLVIEEFCELYQIAPLVRNSYVLSSIWAWLSRIQLNPTVKIPIPRLFTQRDP